MNLVLVISFKRKYKKFLIKWKFLVDKLLIKLFKMSKLLIIIK